MQEVLFGGGHSSVLVDTDAALSELLVRCEHASVVGFDTESAGPLLPKKSGKKPMLNVYLSALVGFSLAFEDGYACYVPVGHGKRRLPPLKALKVFDAFKPGTRVWAHNWKHDVNALRQSGFEVPGHVVPLCSQVAAHSSGQGVPVMRGDGLGFKYGLKPLMEYHMHYATADFNDVLANKGSLFALQGKDVCRYACQDAWGTLQLGQKFLQSMDAEPRESFLQHDAPFALLLADMERWGMGLDGELLRDAERSFLRREAAIRMPWERRWGISIGSSAQLIERFYTTGVWDRGAVRSTATGLPGTDKTALAYHAASATSEEGRKAAVERLEWQRLSKLLGTYTYSLLDLAAEYPDNRLHGSLHQTGTLTGRLSSSDPNMQNMPAHGDEAKLIKSAFVPKPGNVFVTADYSQIELRLLGHYAGGSIRQAYLEGEDLHQKTADLVGCERREAKTINFGIVYGMTQYKLADQLGISEKKAEEFIYKYNKNIPEVEKLKRAVWRRAREVGQIRLCSGAVRKTPGIDSKDRRERSRAERQCFNKLFQGGAAEIAKIAMLNIQKRLGSGGQVVLQVHDEIGIEVPENASEWAVHMLKQEMEAAVALKVPLVAEPSVGKNWGECK